MILRNNAASPRWLPDLGINVAAGDTFEVTGDLAAAYVEQDWTSRVDTPARQKAAAARRKPAPDDTAAAPAADTPQE